MSPPQCHCPAGRSPHPLSYHSYLTGELSDLAVDTGPGKYGADLATTILASVKVDHRCCAPAFYPHHNLHLLLDLVEEPARSTPSPSPGPPQPAEKKSGRTDGGRPRHHHLHCCSVSVTSLGGGEACEGLRYYGGVMILHRCPKSTSPKLKSMVTSSHGKQNCRSCDHLWPSPLET